MAWEVNDLRSYNNGLCVSICLNSWNPHERCSSTLACDARKLSI